MSPLRVEICNERLIQRFGVDRLLILLGRFLAQCGHEVAFTCSRCDRPMLQSISSQVNVISVPPGIDMGAGEAFALEKVAQRWQQQSPDVVVIGGWPFFQTAARAYTYHTKSIFIDAGAVAQNSLPPAYLPMQLELRRIRQLCLPVIDRVLPISDFIRRSQSELDRGSDMGVHTVLLGADHMQLGTFTGNNPAGIESAGDQVRSVVQRGEHPVLLLGRFEAAGYKNSSSGFELLRAVREQVPGTRLLLLDAGQDCGVPADLESAILRLGAPDDETLQEVMSHCTAGVSMSIWEGFNLPLAEMQWVGRPALAFNVGAHPEVIADPWLLSQDIHEMASKLILLLRGEAPIELAEKFSRFRDKRRWETTLASWQREIVVLASHSSTLDVPQGHPRSRRIVVADVTNASLDPANPGVIRVTRKICSQLQQHAHLDLLFVAWNKDSGDYIFLNEKRRQFLESYGGPKDGLGLLATCGQEMTVTQFLQGIEAGRRQVPVLFMPETMLDGQAPARLRWAKDRGYRSAAILYDLIPLFHRELCGAEVSHGFPAYMDSVLRADAVWSISASTLNDFARYAQQTGQAVPGSLEAIRLPGEFAGEARKNGSKAATPESGEIRILCVSTLEPRKNHLRLLQAYANLRKRRPDLRLRLVLVGNRYASAPEIAERIESASKSDPTIQWRGIIDDRALAAEFTQADFSVYPSLVEGYGLPILESLWMACPCLAHSGGVMQELAEGGGCVTVDMSRVDALEAQLASLATDSQLRARLQQEAVNRHLTTWEEYGIELADRLAKL